VPLIALAASGASGIGPFPAIGIAIAGAGLGVWRPVLAGRVAAFGILLVSVVFIVLGKTAW